MKKKIINYLWEFIRPYKWSFVNALFCILMTSIISMSYPYIFGILVDEVFYNKNLQFFFYIVLIYGLIYFTEQLLHLILNILWPYQYNLFMINIRKKIYEKILISKYETLSLMPVGDMINKINWQADSFIELVHRNIAFLCSDSLILILLLSIVYNINYFLLILLIINIIVSYYLSYHFGQIEGNYQKSLNNYYKKFCDWILEILYGIRDIKLFNGENYVTEKFVSQINLLNDTHAQVIKAEIVSERINSLWSLISRLLLYILTSMLICYDKITLGQFIAAITYFEKANSLLEKINKYMGKIHGNLTNINEIVLFLEGEEEQTKGYPDIRVTEGEIEFKNVTFTYKSGLHVLKKLSFKIDAGNKIALVGKSGAGKSTVANILLRMLEAEQGVVTIDRQNICMCSTESVRKAIGIVQQEIFIFDGTIRYNLLLGNSMATESELWEALNNVYLKDFVINLKYGLDTMIGSDGINMSGGEKQRLAMARLFLNSPSIIIFDEATSALDAETEVYVNKAWQRLSLGRTVIIIAHRISTIITADKVLIIENGEVAGYDTHETLLQQNNFYKNLYQEQYLYLGKSQEPDC